MMKSQKQMFYEAVRRMGIRDSHVMELIHDKDNPLTKEDLHRLADRFPDRWERYRGLLDS